MHTDYSGVDLKQVVRRGIGRVRPANDKGEELRDVILWLIVLHYAKQSKAGIAFVSEDKTFQHTDGTLHPTLQSDIGQAGVSIAFYRSIGDFVKGNAVESETLERAAIAAYVSYEELRRIATEHLLRSRFGNGTIVGAEVSRCDLTEARRYRVADDSYYVEARYAGEGTIRLRSATVTTRFNLPQGSATPKVTDVTNVIGTVVPRSAPPNEATFIQDEVSLPEEATKVFFGLPPYNQLLESSPEAAYNVAEDPYRCRFSIRLSLRIVADKRESLEVDELVLVVELFPRTTGST